MIRGGVTATGQGARRRAHPGRLPWGGVVAAAVMVAATGCRPPRRLVRRPHARAERVRVRSFTDLTAVRQIVVAPPYAFTATDDGLDRWDLGNGEHLHIGRGQGLPAGQVSSLALDGARRWLWVATAAGITRYNIEDGSFAAVPPPPGSARAHKPAAAGARAGKDAHRSGASKRKHAHQSGARDAGQPAGSASTGATLPGPGDLAKAVIAPAADGGVWIGGAMGLVHADTHGHWRRSAFGHKVTALYRDRAGTLWIGTAAGLATRAPSGRFSSLSRGDHCRVGQVRFIAPGPGGGPLVVGDLGGSRQRIALVHRGRCHVYRASPNWRWRAATSVGGRLIILTNRRLYATPRGGGPHRLHRDGVRLLSVEPGAARDSRNPYRFETLRANLPAGARSLAASENEVFVGTDNLGTARIPLRRSGRIKWLRRRDLTAGASSLTVACARPDVCYVATGARRAWLFDNNTFKAASDGSRQVMAVVRSPDGRIYGVERSRDGDAIEFSRIEGGKWTDVQHVRVETPGGRPEITFAKFSGSGILWIGLRYRDNTGDLRPYGVALVDLSLGQVVYHHESANRKELAKGVLPIPIHVMDAGFAGGDAWLATSEGAAEVNGKKVKVYTEADGLLDEWVRGIACSAGGAVFVASRQGVGVFDGRAWNYPPVLQFAVNDLAIGPDGRLWMATSRGLAMYDGARVRRLDDHRGLLQNQVANVEVDHFGRVWVRGSEGITVVAP